MTTRYRNVCVSLRDPSDYDDAEAVLDALAEHFYGLPSWVRRFVEPLIHSTDRRVFVAGLPAWLPDALARQWVARVAARAPVKAGGYAVVTSQAEVIWNDGDTAAWQGVKGR